MISRCFLDSFVFVGLFLFMLRRLGKTEMEPSRPLQTLALIGCLLGSEGPAPCLGELVGHFPNLLFFCHYVTLITLISLYKKKKNQTFVNWVRKPCSYSVLHWISVKSLPVWFCFWFDSCLCSMWRLQDADPMAHSPQPRRQLQKHNKHNKQTHTMLHKNVQA